MQIDNWYTASSLKTAGQTLTALAKRGYVDRKSTTPAQYKITDKGQKYIRIFNYINNHKTPLGFYTFHKKDAELGMLCSVKGQDLVDYEYKYYDIDMCDEVEIKHKQYIPI